MTSILHYTTHSTNGRTFELTLALMSSLPVFVADALDLLVKQHLDVGAQPTLGKTVSGGPVPTHSKLDPQMLYKTKSDSQIEVDVLPVFCFPGYSF